MNHRLFAPLFSAVFALSASAQEICNNAIDDDADGLIDLNDPDCLCGYTLNDAVYSRIANPSFEDRLVQGEITCCPFGYVSPGSPNWVSCAAGWYTATIGSTDYLHACGFLPEELVPLPMPAGDGCMGVIAMPGYNEYIGRPVWTTPLRPDSSYTLQLWAASTSIGSIEDENLPWSIGRYYATPMSLTLYGRSNVVAFPVATMGCLGEEPGWVELATVEMAATGAWQTVRFEFTPADTVKQFAVGGMCAPGGDLVPTQRTFVVDGVPMSMGYAPYTLLDGFTLNATDDFIVDIMRSGSLCTDDLMLSAAMPGGVFSGQWYHNGVAITGSTAAQLDVTSTVDDGGWFVFTSQAGANCYRSEINIAPRPAFTATPATGPAPLTVTFVATSTNGTATWTFGDGTTLQGDTVVHTFTGIGNYDVQLEHPVEGCTLSTTLEDAVTVEEGTSMDERTGTLRFNVVPNPVSDVLRAEPGAGFTSYRVLNALGQEVQRGAVVNGRIEVATPAVAGGYLLHVEGPGKQAMARFVK